jgi:hypothetical protein
MGVTVCVIARSKLAFTILFLHSSMACFGHWKYTIYQTNASRSFSVSRSHHLYLSTFLTKFVSWEWQNTGENKYVQ